MQNEVPGSQRFNHRVEVCNFVPAAVSVASSAAGKDDTHIRAGEEAPEEKAC